MKSFCRTAVAGLLLAGIPWFPAGAAEEPRVISLRGLSRTSGAPGDTFEMRGVWGSQTGKWPSINRGNARKLEVLSWTPTNITVRIPADLSPGVYKVGVYWRKSPGDSTMYGSTFRDFTVTAGPAPPAAPSEEPATDDGATGVAVTTKVREFMRRLPAPFVEFVQKIGIILAVCLVLGLIGNATTKRPKDGTDEFPVPTSDSSPFVGFSGSGNTLQVSVNARQVVCQVSSWARIGIALAVAVFGPGVTALVYFNPEDVEEWPTFVEYLVAFFALIGWTVPVATLLTRRRFVIDRRRDEILFFSRPGGKVMYRLSRDRIARLATRQTSHTTSSSGGSSRTYTCHTIAVTPKDGKEIVLCASGRKDVIDNLMEHLRPMAPKTQEPPAPASDEKRTGVKIRLNNALTGLPPEAPDLPAWDGMCGEEPYSVECLGYAGDDPITTVSIPLDESLPNPLEVNARDGAPSLEGDPRAGLVRRLLELGVNYVDISYNTNWIAAEVPSSSGPVDEARAEEIVRCLTQLRDASS